jgi:hypothetical protein
MFGLGQFKHVGAIGRGEILHTDLNVNTEQGAKKRFTDRMTHILSRNVSERKHNLTVMKYQNGRRTDLFCIGRCGVQLVFRP